MKQNLEQNKNNAIAFYKMAYEGEARKAVELYVGNDYIQHNPLVGNGKEPFMLCSLPITLKDPSDCRS